MIRNPKVGERVVVLRPDGQPRTSGRNMTKRPHNDDWEGWDFSKGNTGAIEYVFRARSGRLGFIVVRPDPPNTGTHWFRAGELRRI